LYLSLFIKNFVNYQILLLTLNANLTSYVLVHLLLNSFISIIMIYHVFYDIRFWFTIFVLLIEWYIFIIIEQSIEVLLVQV